MIQQKIKIEQKENELEILKNGLSNQSQQIDGLKQQLEAKDQEIVKLKLLHEKSSKAILEEMKNETERVELELKSKLKRQQEYHDEEMEEIQKKMRKSEQAHLEQIRSTRYLLKRESMKLQEKDYQITRLKQTNSREIAQVRNLLIEKELQIRSSGLKINQQQEQIQLLKKKLAKTEGRSCTTHTLSILLILACLLLFVFYNASMVLGFEVVRRDDALAYQTHAYQQQIKILNEKHNQQKRYLEDKSGCSIM